MHVRTSVARAMVPWMALTGLGVGLGWGCSRDPVPARVPPAAPDPPAVTSAAAPARLALAFVPEFLDATDVAVAEERRYRVRITVSGEGELPAARLVSSCDCLSAEFATPLTREGGEVDVIVKGSKPEDIDGVVTLEDAGRQRLAELVCTIRLTRKTFVFPREIVLPPGETSFQVAVLHAFAPRDTQAEIELEDTVFGECFLPVGFDPVEELTLDSLVKGVQLSFELADPAATAPIQETIRILMAEPAGEFEIKISRRE